ncbi:MAG: hypothetical protein C5B52_01160 [Bacteroidetes bacterium]|nr:MAG: hypothetical protein C5B52_01160 [Bacteroidota bacterium]
MERREFIIEGCRICLLTAAVAGISGLSSCGPSYPVFKTEMVDNKLQVPLSLFDKNALQVISPRKFQYEIAVQKNSDDTYKALLLRCTHQSNQLIPTGKGYLCSLHGSTFDKEGNVTKGPAELKLKELKTEVSGTNLIVFI